MVLQCAYGYLQYFFNLSLGLIQIGINEAEPFPEQLGGRTVRRIGALMNHPNVFSAYLAMLLPIPTALLFSRISGVMKVLMIGLLLFGQIALMLTLSRNGWISFGLALVVVLGLSMVPPLMRRRYAVVRGILLAVCVIIAAFFAERAIDRFLHSDPVSAGARWIFVDIGFRMIADRPFFGFGLNTWAYEMPAYIRSTDIIPRAYADPGSVPPSHNLYLQKWVEQGTVGLILMLTMMGALVRIGLRNLRVKDDIVCAINIGALGGLVAMMVHGLADWVFYRNDIMRIWWILASIIVAIHYWHRDTERAAADAARAPG
jgi:O-antigen ligase